MFALNNLKKKKRTDGRQRRYNPKKYSNFTFIEINLILWSSNAYTESDRRHKKKNPNQPKNHKATAHHGSLKHNNMDLNTITICQSKLSGKITSFWRGSFENKYSFAHAAAKFD